MTAALDALDGDAAHEAAVRAEARGERPPPAPKIAPRSTARYRVWTPPEIWSAIEPPVYALATITRGDVAMACAHGDSLKSWAAINAVTTKAAGRAWLERFTSEPAPTLYLDAEMGSDECRRRMQRNARGCGLVGPIDGVSLVSMPGFRLSTSEGMAEVRKLAHGRALMAIDSLAAFCPDVDENDARFADPLKALKEIGDATGCAFLVLHHSRKSSANGNTGDERERPRGTSALFAACDVVFQLSRARDGFLVQQTKARKGKATNPFVLRIADTDDTATRVYAVDVDDVGDAVADCASKLERAKRAVMALLGRDHDVRSANEAARRLKGSASRPDVLEAIKELRERRLAVEHEGTLRLASEVRS